MRKTTIWLIALTLCSSSALAQNLMKQMKRASGASIVYVNSYKGKASPVKTVASVSGTEQKLENLFPESKEKYPEMFPKETTYVDFADQTIYRTALLQNGDTLSAITPFEFGSGLKVTGETKFMGLNCKIAKTSIRSNSVEIWYTEDLGIDATPQPGYGIPHGVVLKTIMNGDRVTEAEKITPVKKSTPQFPASWGKIMNADYYRYTLNQSNVITVPIFKENTVNFSGAKSPESYNEGEVYNVGGGTIILKKVKLPEFERDYGVFLELSQYSQGDAYDRTGSVFVVPTDKKLSFLDALKDLKAMPSFTAANGKTYPALVSTPDYTVPVELMRFFTAFGVREFNKNVVPGQNWVDSVLYKADVTNLARELRGEVIIGAYIGNWDANGHKISLNVKYYPGESDAPYHKVMPLFNTVNYLEQAGQEYPIFLGNDSLKVKFTLTEDARNAQLFYLTTGHGGWGGGDEFNQKVNTIYVDGVKVAAFIPWRDDCGTYRNLNPCSGNFSNGLSSSDLSRSNWCPGTMTNPEYIPLGDLKAGEHTLTIQIPQGAPEGGSLSYWCLSGSLIY